MPAFVGDAAAADRIELEARERTLLAEHQVEWLRPLGLEPSRAGWRRGFVERVQGDWGWFRGAVVDLAARTPLRHVRVYHVDIAEVCALAWPASVVSLAMFSGDLGTAAARARRGSVRSIGCGAWSSSSARSATTARARSRRRRRSHASRSSPCSAPAASTP